MSQWVSEFEVLTDHKMLSDHAPIMVNLNISGTYLKSSKKPIFNFHKADWSKFRASLNSDPPVETLNDVDELNKFITNEINSAADKAITKINFSKNNKDQLPKPILDLIRERRTIRGRAKKDEVARKHYNFLSKEINRAITEHTSQK